MSNNVYKYVFERDGGVCQVCGKHGNEIHHIVPRSQGGSDYSENLILLCITHHKYWHECDNENKKQKLQDYFFERVKSNEAEFNGETSHWYDLNEMKQSIKRTHTPTKKISNPKKSETFVPVRCRNPPEFFTFLLTGGIK